MTWAQVLSAKPSKNTSATTAATAPSSRVLMNEFDEIDASAESNVGISTSDSSEMIPLDSLELEDKKIKKTSSKSEKKKSKQNKKKTSQESIKIPKQPQYAKVKIHSC